MESKVNRNYIKPVSKIVTAHAGHFCSCKFPLEDKYGKYKDYRPHDNWELWHQNHGNSNFDYFLKCIGCGYELAKQYWRDLNGTFVDYTDGIAEAPKKKRRFVKHFHADGNITFGYEECE